VQAHARTQALLHEKLALLSLDGVLRQSSLGPALSTRGVRKCGG
jgi:hypothetical protein